MNNLTARKSEILLACVRLYIETSKPVSSGLVARSLQGAYSPATIRAEMKSLEENGFLLQPHTSSGRLPTDHGYRIFVDQLLASWPVQHWEHPRHLQQFVASNLQRLSGSGQAAKVLAELLSTLTANIGIILGPSWESIRAERVDLYPKEGRRILMVLVLENALVRTGVFTFDREYPRAVVTEAARILSERIAGRTVAAIRAGILHSFDAAASPAGHCASALAQRGRELFADAEAGEIELEGVANLLDEPEFSDPGRLKALVRFMESPGAIREALTRLNLEAGEGIGVWIGTENPIDDLRFFSLLSSPF
ncbi:MAG: hypothetical protein ABIF77_00730, partial [bacterium]